VSDADESVHRFASEAMLARLMMRIGHGLSGELLEGGHTGRLSPVDMERISIALGITNQIEARYGPSSARLWFDNPNVFLNSGDEIRPIEMLASDDPDRYSKLQCALNIHLGEPLYDQ